ncbi:MAG: T9SS type A sorting domain-containing protein [Candidatus Poribacteria bacterium]|nr:T9SS type A sorting domain-containing protein [Candidatus Poribacteria bacterium]MDE0505609.1 T9SS type A sorting domain-containing protein [Candidatus Poribacteria bacterium]
MDFTHPEVQDIIVQQAISVSRCGLLDGIIFDYWRDEDDVLHGYVSVEAQLQARLNIVRRIRAATRPNFLIQVNSNTAILPHTGKYINGLSMETGIPNWGKTPEEREAIVTDIEKTVVWAEENMREPRINAIFREAFRIDEKPRSANFQWVRLITTLSLTHADGYAMIQHLGLPWGDDRHWHDFWNADLGQPASETQQLYQETEGLYIREFTNGWAVYNHSEEPQTITLPEEVQGIASGSVGTEHTLPNLDGEIYLRVKPGNPADVNGDGVVNILDLVMVAQAFGKDGLQGDGAVNILDLVLVAGAIGAGGAAPSAYSLDLSIFSATDVERWLASAQGLGIGDANFQRGIRFLEGLLASLTPKETTLLPNYPNPFNPETWIPYHLARSAEVAITIFDTKGTLVRRLALGNQAAGYYAERGKAAYWDGRNEDGEAVASGIYIYQFRAGNYAASRRMVILK